MTADGALWKAAVILGAALGGGAMNAVAGGGTVLSFPALMWIGLPPIEANATSAVALWPASLGGAWGFRREIVSARGWWAWLGLPSVAGGAVGAYLLVHTPSHLFASIAPWLVLAATVAMALDPVVRRWLRFGGEPSRARLAAAALAQLVVALYGGYFGAGMGILILATLGLVGVASIHQANGLKNVLTLGIKGVAAIYFVAAGRVAWDAGALMAVAAIAGGYAGARLGRTVNEQVMRAIVVAVGVAMTAALFAGMRV